MKIRELRARLEDAGLDAKYADVIESQAQPCLRFDAIPTDEGDLPVGGSKLGGSPDLRIGSVWPQHGERRLAFLGQIDLQDFNPYPFCRVLPSEGLLSFFLDLGERPEEYDPADRGNWRVIFHPGPREELERRLRPELGFTPAHFKPCRIVLHEARSPGWQEIPIHALHLDDFQQDEFQYFIDCLPDERAHQVLGRPGRVEDLGYALQLECQFMSNGLLVGEDGKPTDEARAKEVEPGAAEWRLLLQLDSDDGAGMDWGDFMISFWIRERDLQEHNFSEAWQIDECF